MDDSKIPNVPTFIVKDTAIFQSKNTGIAISEVFKVMADLETNQVLCE